MQNRLNDVEYFNRNNPQKYSLCRFSDRDNAFFRRGYIESFELGYRNLINLRERYSPSIVQKFIQLVEFLTEDKERIVDELANMPFAWQHHDFREDNIIGEKQVLVDWGSSYGYGPFMYDLAPFWLNNRRSLEVYTGSSEICRKEAKLRIERWVYVSAAVRVIKDQAQAVEACQNLVKGESIHSILLCPGFTHQNIAEIAEAVGHNVGIFVARGDSPSFRVTTGVMEREGWFSKQ